MKIVKFFVVFNLILSISLINSVAAISVSDGSAFVTKAEFSADLNNLSNRMSTLENSLDAKIDSLVSSYLSRNGIWNGEKQEKKQDVIPMGTQIKFPNNDINNKFFILQKDVELISSLSKSGLVRFKVSRDSRLVGAIDTITPPYANATGGMLSVVIYVNNKKISNDLNLSTWYNASSFTSVSDSNMSSWVFSNMSEIDMQQMLLLYI